jgi:hypothetical protein
LGAPLGQTPILLTHITLSWKGLPGANTLPYFAGVVSDEEKCFKIFKILTIGPYSQTFFFVTYQWAT